jgi:hypothetical protein
LHSSAPELLKSVLAEAPVSERALQGNVLESLFNQVTANPTCSDSVSSRVTAVHLAGLQKVKPGVTHSNLFNFLWLALTDCSSKALYLATTALRCILVEKLQKHFA